MLSFPIFIALLSVLVDYVTAFNVSRSDNVSSNILEGFFYLDTQTAGRVLWAEQLRSNAWKWSWQLAEDFVYVLPGMHSSIELIRCLIELVGWQVRMPTQCMPSDLYMILVSTWFQSHFWREFSCHILCSHSNTFCLIDHSLCTTLTLTHMLIFL